MQSLNIASNPVLERPSSATKVLKDGQMLSAKVIKIYPNNTAEIAVGQNKMTAVVDAPIKVGERYLFQVQNNGDATSLKVLPSNGSNQTMKEIAVQLLQHFSLPPSKENVTLAQFFLKNDLPLTKENITQAMQWIQSNGEVSKSLHIMKMMRDLSLPFSHDVFKAIAAFENKVPLTSLFTSLSQSVLNHEGETAVSLKAVLSQLLLSNVDKAAEHVLFKMINTWLNTEGNVKDSMFRLLQEVGFFSKQATPTSVLTNSLQLASNNQSLVQNPSVKQAINLLVDINNNNDPKQVKPLQESFQQLVNNKVQELSRNVKEAAVWKQVQSELKQANPNSAILNNAQTTNGQSVGTKQVNRESVSVSQLSFNNIAKHFLANIMRTEQNFVKSHELLRLFAEAGTETDQALNNLEKARTYISNQLLQAVEGKSDSLMKYNSMDKQLFQNLIQEEVVQLSASKSSIFSQEMKSALKLIGVGLEHQLANLDASATIKENELLTLKPLLMKLVNETHSSAVRDQAEQLLNKITAQQLLSQSSGPIQHVITQFPITFHRFQTEVTMQWSGRKKKDGEIDPAFCRVLFYLHLEHIQETIIDLVVQNKVMKISVINENASLLQTVSKSLIQAVKDKLESIGFKLSTIQFELPNPLNQQALQFNRKSDIYDTSPYNGVDIKI